MEISIPDIIDLDFPERYILTLKVHPEQFSLTIHEAENENCRFYYKIPEHKGSDSFSAFKQFFFENSFLAFSFKKMYIMNHSREFTFVPNFLYNEPNQKELMQFNFSHAAGKLLVQKIRQTDTTILHRMPTDTFQFLNRSFDNPQFIHHLSPLIIYFQKKSLSSDTLQLSVNLYEKDLDILCFSHGNFILGNHFKLNQAQEAFYYILFVCKQLKLEQTTDFVYCCGNRSQQAELIQGLSPFIKNIVPLNLLTSDSLLETDIPFELSNPALCEL